MEYGKLLGDNSIKFFNPEEGLKIEMGMVMFNPNVDTLNKYNYYEIKRINEVGTNHIEGTLLIYYIGHETTLDEAKELKLEEIATYDTSSAVNEFIINDEKMWIARELRESLSDTLANEIATGLEEFTEWYNNKPYTFKTSEWETMLSAVKHYAYVCYCKTQEHIANVNALTTVEEVQNYDYTVGYPEKVVFKV